MTRLTICVSALALAWAMTAGQAEAAGYRRLAPTYRPAHPRYYPNPLPRYKPPAYYPPVRYNYPPQPRQWDWRDYYAARLEHQRRIDAITQNAVDNIRRTGQRLAASAGNAFQ